MDHTEGSAHPEKTRNAADIDLVLDFWFREASPQQHFTKDKIFDDLIRSRFEKQVKQALASQLDSWAATPHGCLALILLLDQFTRNIYRDTPQAFSGDEIALALSLKAVDRGDLEALTPEERRFLLMPMMHSEDLDIQEASLPLFRDHAPGNTYEYAVRHRDIIARFNRFPHRNIILGRPSSKEEEMFLTEPGSSF